MTLDCSEDYGRRPWIAPKIMAVNPMAIAAIDNRRFRKSLFLDSLASVCSRSVLCLSASFCSLSISSSMVPCRMGLLAMLLPQIPHITSASWQMVSQR